MFVEAKWHDCPRTDAQYGLRVTDAVVPLKGSERGRISDDDRDHLIPQSEVMPRQIVVGGGLNGDVRYALVPVI
jgi:hypothetical protein